MRVKTRGKHFVLWCVVYVSIFVFMCTGLWGFVKQFEAKINKVICLMIFRSIRLTFFLLTKTFAVFFCSFLVSVLLTWRLPSTAAPCECCAQPWRSKLSDVARPLFFILHWKHSMKAAGFPSAGPLGFLLQRLDVQQLAFWCQLELAKDLAAA